MELTEITEPSQAIALYKITPAEIAERLKEYDDLKVIEADTGSYKQVRAALTAIVSTRVEGDKRRKKLGEKLRKQVSDINEAWKMLFAPMVPYEDRFSAELKAEDDRKQAIKDEKDRIEKLRIDNIDMKIMSIDHAISRTLNMTSSQIGDLAGELSHIEITEEEYQEFTGKAMDVKAATLSALDDIFDEKV